MCGIGVIYAKKFTEVDEVVLFDLVDINTSRGKDSIGVVIYDVTETKLIRETNFQSTKGFKDFILDQNLLGNEIYIVFNTRAEPLPEMISDAQTAQPFILEHPKRTRIVSHNGTIPNDQERAKELGIDIKVDSEILLYDMTTNLPYLQKGLARLEGGIAAVFLEINDKTDIGLVLYRNFKPLSYIRRKGNLYVSSEARHLQHIVKYLPKHLGPMDNRDPIKIPPYSGIIFPRAANSMGNRMIPFEAETKIASSLPKQDPGKAIVICSGGIDSVTTAYVAKHLLGYTDLTLVHFNYGQLAYESEDRAVNEIGARLWADVETIDIRFMGNWGNSPLTDESIELPLGIQSAESTRCWVPARNLVMMSLVSAYAEAKGVSRIFTGFNLEESGSYPDNDIEFFEQFNKTLDFGTLTRPRIVMVLERLMKVEIIKLGQSLNVPYDLTWSCDLSDSKQRACGRCGCCWNRRHAFLKAGIKDLQLDKYQNDIQEKDIVEWSKKDISYNVDSLESIRKRIQVNSK